MRASAIDTFAPPIYIPARLAIMLAVIVHRIALYVGTVMLSTLPSGAALLLDDPFNYPDGALVNVSSGVWAHHSGSVSGEVMASSGRVLLSEANTEDVNALLAGQPYPPSGATAVFYASFRVRFTALPSNGGAYFAHFKDSGTGYRARVWALTSGATPGKFRLGISSTSGSAISSVIPTDLSLNTDYIVVTRLVNSNSISTLWINPTSSDAGVSTSEGASAFTAVSYALRESVGEGDLSLDDLRVGTSFDDVVFSSDQPPAITLQPQNQTATNGMDVRFNAGAEGTPPLHYQWQHDGTNLPDATASNLVLTATTFAQAGFYAVVVTNIAGSTISEPVVLSVWRAAIPAFSYLTYNVAGNGLTNWSTNMWHVQAIGRQLRQLNPDIITFQEIPITNSCTAQMFDFVTTYCPGYFLATNSESDGFIHSVILSRYPILVSTSRLHNSDLTPYGCTNSNFTRDLFEAQIAVPGFQWPLHVFTVHLKAGQDADSAAKRAAEAAAISNYFATVYLPASNQQPYILSGDMNEDIVRPPAGNPQSVQHLVGARTGLQLATPVNPFTDSEQTWSIRDDGGPSKRYDYVLPCGSLLSNVVSSQVFRTDLLSPMPPNLNSDDDKIASDHLPVFVVFANPFNTPFRLLSFEMADRTMTLKWESQSSRTYTIEASSNLTAWLPFATNLAPTDAVSSFTTNAPDGVRFFRVYRAP